MTAAWSTPAALPVIRVGTPIMVRPGNRLHIGVDPRRGVLVELHPHIDAHQVAELLESLRQPCDPPEIVTRAQSLGLTAHDVDSILDRLVTDGSADPPCAQNPEGITLRVVLGGRGPLTQLLRVSLAEADLLVTEPDDGGNLVVLTDFLVPDPTLVNSLLNQRIPHLQVRVRDDVGLVGPLVLPGLSSCLRCADLHRSSLDPEWPILAAQLIGRPGRASDATIHATAALAHGQIEELATTLRRPTPGDRPPLVDRVLHLQPDPLGVEFSSWPPHPQCGCRRPLSCGGERKL